MIRKYNVEFIGVTPLLMHSCRGANPLDPQVKEIKQYTSKRKKTDDDQLEIARLEYKLNAYHDSEIGFYIPAEVIEATIIEGAKKNRKGKQALVSIEVTNPKNPLNCDAPKDIDKAYLQPEFADVRNVVVNDSRIIRTRPRFNRWKLPFEIKVDESLLNFDEFIQALNCAGSLVGMCDFRPKYGRFEVKVEEIS